MPPLTGVLPAESEEMERERVEKKREKARGQFRQLVFLEINNRILYTIFYFYTLMWKSRFKKLDNNRKGTN